MDEGKLVSLLERAVSDIETPLISGDVEGTGRKHSRSACEIKTSSEAWDQLLSFIGNCADLEVLNNSMLNTGDGAGTGVTQETLAKWLLCAAMENGPAEAVNRLQKFLGLDATPAYRILALSGFKVNKSVKISDSVHLMPFQDIRDSDAKELFESIVQMQGFQPPQLPDVALIHLVKISPKVFKGMQIPPRISGISEVLHEICDCLTLVGSCAPQPVAEWTWFEDWVPCASYSLLGRIFPSPAFEPARKSPPYTFSDHDCSEVADLVSKYLTLNPETKRLLRIALQRLNQSRQRGSLVDRAIDLGIALEVILLNDRTVDDSISFPFRLRGAWLLGKDAAERRDCLKLLKDVYSCRSKAVHTGKFNGKSARGLSLPVNDILTRGDELGVSMIRRILQLQEFPDWDDLVLG